MSGSRLRQLLRRVRRLPERLLHHRRRRRARERLARLSDRSPLRVLVLCHGNICRSPYAAARLSRLLEEALGPGAATVESGGFIGPGRPPPLTAREVAAERGLDVGGHRSSLVSAARARDADLIVTMTAEQVRRLRDRAPDAASAAVVLGDLDPEAPERRDIRDPVQRPADVFREVFDRIDRCVEALVEAIAVGDTVRAANG